MKTMPNTHVATHTHVSDKTHLHPTDAELSPQVAAYERRLPEMEALTDPQLAPQNLDILGAVMTVRGAVARIETLRAEMLTLPATKHAVVDGLDDYALATAQAHAIWSAATSCW